MTTEERIAAVRRFGYSESEALFLSLSALHGGYFLRRQYALFIDKKDGGNVTQLVQKALANGHVQSSTWRQNTQLYHLCARPFYEAIGQGENRNRRTREVLTIKNKVMGFDFVLAHPQVQYLATEQEKVDYFTQTLKLDLAALPSKHYPSKNSTVFTPRYFVDKYPIFVPTENHELPASASASGMPSAVSFCYVDEGTISLSRFKGFLSRCSPLFDLLPAFHLVYVAASRVHFGAARHVFEGFLRRNSDSAMAAGRPPIERLLAYFKARHLFETGQLETFDRAKLIRLRQEQNEFSSSEYETLYTRWQATGDDSTLDPPESQTALRRKVLGVFSTFHLEHDYELFGQFPG